MLKETPDCLVNSPPTLCHSLTLSVPGAESDAVSHVADQQGGSRPPRGRLHRHDASRLGAASLF